MGKEFDTKNVVFRMMSLHQLVRTGNVNQVKAVLQNHPEIDVNDEEEDTCSALHIASFMGNVELVELLISHKADVNQTDKSLGILWTPLHRAIVSGFDFLTKQGFKMKYFRTRSSSQNFSSKWSLD